jgi:hypothetical protein
VCGVAGEGWTGGYTGTLLSHGTQIDFTKIQVWASRMLRPQLLKLNSALE